MVATGARKGRSRKARPPMARASRQGGWQGEKATTGRSVRLPSPQLQAAGSLEKPQTRQLGSLWHHLSSFQPSFPLAILRVSPSTATRAHPTVIYGSRSGQALGLPHYDCKLLAPQQPHCNSSVLSKSYIRAPTKTPRQLIHWGSSGMVALCGLGSLNHRSNRVYHA